MGQDVQRCYRLRPAESGPAVAAEVLKTAPQRLELEGAFRPIQLRPPSARLPLFALKVMTPGGAGLVDRDIQPELVSRELDQLVDEAVLKLARSSMKACTCSRSHAITSAW